MRKQEKKEGQELETSMELRDARSDQIQMGDVLEDVIGSEVMIVEEKAAADPGMLYLIWQRKCNFISKSYCTRRSRVQITEIIARGEAERDYLSYCTRRGLVQ